MGKNPNKINEYRIVDGTVYMKPTNNKDIEFMFDEEDLEKILPYKWYIMPQGYIVTKTNPNTGKSCWRIHHCILDFVYNGTTEIDHADRNRLNNKKNNLREVPHRVNNRNGKLRTNSTKSGYIGVNWCEEKQKWHSTIFKEGKRYYQGAYDTIEEALIARLKAELNLFGAEYAPQRHLFKEYGIE